LIFVYGKSSRLDPHRPAEAAGPGIITALYALTRVLARHGHDVSVVGRISHRAVVDGVAFHDRSELPQLTADSPPDALIVIPDLLSLLLPLPARARIVWSGNAYAIGDVALTERWSWAEDLGRPGRRARLWPLSLYANAIDRFVAKSDWQADQVHRSCGIPLSKMTVIHNGVPDVFFQRRSVRRHPARLVYTSQARRGLSVLLELFPQVRNAVPEAELHVFGYDQAGTDGAGRHLPPGIVFRGAVDKQQLARELEQAALYVYPCTFDETFCTSVAEAQAAGLPVVATGLAALNERVDDGRDGYLITGPAGHPFARDDFVDAVIRLLTDHDLRGRMGVEAEKKARRAYDWDVVAAHWQRKLGWTRDRPISFPALDPNIELLTPALLHLSDRGAHGQVPAALAEQWLRGNWSSYGFDPSGAPASTSPKPRREDTPSQLNVLN
jgi:glycosyltransferase involved in cell wall biosynthesis